MTVAELIKALQKYPADMVVVNDKYSDYQYLESCDLFIIQGIPKTGYVMRPHPSLDETTLAQTRQFLCVG